MRSIIFLGIAISLISVSGWACIKPFGKITPEICVHNKDKKSEIAKICTATVARTKSDIVAVYYKKKSKTIPGAVLDIILKEEFSEKENGENLWHYFWLSGEVKNEEVEMFRILSVLPENDKKGLLKYNVKFDDEGLDLLTGGRSFKPGEVQKIAKTRCR